MPGIVQLLMLIYLFLAIVWMADIQIKALFLQLLTTAHTTKVPRGIAEEKEAFRKETVWGKWEDMSISVDIESWVDLKDSQASKSDAELTLI